MQISILGPGRRVAITFRTKFVLKQDDFNDYGFLTRYGVYRAGRTDDEPYYFLVSVKILKKGQKDTDGFQVTTDITRGLAANFCSIGASLDYYERLNELDQNEKDELVSTLRDVAAGKALVQEFESEPGWKTSLFRGATDWHTYVEDASALFHGNFAVLPDVEGEFSFRPAQSEKAITFALDAPVPDSYLGSFRRLGPSKRKTLLPERALVIIGRNGSGKSTILANLAHVAFATPEERTRKSMLKKGKLEPNGIGFPRVITVSYSAFDSFEVPGSSDSDFAQIARDITNGEGRFVYCGLRDIAAEAKLDHDNQLDEAEASANSKQSDTGDRRTTTMLKSLDQLADEFVRLLVKIDTSDRKRALLKAAIEPLAADPSFAEMDFEVALSATNARETFLFWSTGHKIALHVVVSLVAHASRNALILFDEPETHLHPPLAAALMHSVRIVLSEVSALCVIATHSPVILQETLARHVRFVDRVDNEIEITTPTRETFGENVGLLTYDAFSLTASSTDFHKILDLLIEGFDTIEQIEPVFTNGLSSQARAYVMSKYAMRRKTS